MSAIERRRSIRFELRLSIIVRWKNRAETREAVTLSQDVSSKGIYFYLPERIKSGTDVQVEMTLPNQITLTGPVRIRYWGRIQRCELGGGAHAGIAAALERYEFLAGNQEAPEEDDSSSISS